MADGEAAYYNQPHIISKPGATGEVIGKQGAWLNLKTPGGAARRPRHLRPLISGRANADWRA